LRIAARFRAVLLFSGCFHQKIAAPAHNGAPSQPFVKYRRSKVLTIVKILDDGCALFDEGSLSGGIIYAQ
jgi:hypothetical protein